ncbi:MAG: DUF1934 domain-containing protein [Clostridiales bacterium]|nr:DUF1934 domain-containing protein [Clostridiales bacterium]
MKDILLRIVGSQGVGEKDGDQIEFVTEGHYTRKEDGSILLSYEETELSGMEGCTTHLEVAGNRVRMSRSGEPVPVDTIMEFEKGKRYNGLYETAYGAIDMEILTNDVLNKLIVHTSGEASAAPLGADASPSGTSAAPLGADIVQAPKGGLSGSLHIDYHISLKGLGEVHNRLDVEIL